MGLVVTDAVLESMIRVLEVKLLKLEIKTMSFDSAAHDSAFQNSSRVAQRTVTYSKKDGLDQNADVRLLFHGLLWFTFHGTDECEIGIHNTTQGHIFPQRYPHELDVSVWTITGCTTGQRRCTLFDNPDHRIGNPKNIEGIQIDVNNPRAGTSGVYVYEKDPFRKPPEPQSGNDPNDWRWVLDFEQAPFYAGGIQLNPDAVNPVVSINHGLFYTLLKTTSTFQLLPGSDTPISIGHVAQYLGCNIYLEPNGEVKVTIRYRFPHPSKTFTLRKAANTCYEIDITNDCYKNNDHCVFEKPDHPTDKKKRNDFYLYYDCFDVPDGFEEIGLKQSAGGTPPSLPPYICYQERQDRKESNNESPCGSVVAGRGGNGT